MKKILSVILAIALLGQFFPVIAFASSFEKQNLEESLIKEVNVQRNKAIEDIKSQLIEQDRLDHLEHYVEIINKLAKSDIERIKENFNVSSENKTLSSYSLIDAPRGAVATNRNEYATSTYVFIPHNQIDSVLAGHASGIISFAYATVASWYAKIAWLPIMLAGIDAINVSLLRSYQNQGYSVIKMNYIDHTEADRGSGGYVKWNNPTKIDTSIFHNVKKY